MAGPRRRPRQAGTRRRRLGPICFRCPDLPQKQTRREKSHIKSHTLRQKIFMPYNIFSDLPRIAAALHDEPWLILPSHHRSMVEQIAAHRSQPQAYRPGRSSSQDEAPPVGYVNAITSYDKASGLAVIDVKGAIGKGLSSMATSCGGFDLNTLEDGLARLADIKPRAVQMYFNTPGGTVTGIEEASAAIEEFSMMTAPIHAYSDALCCSAGEWLAASASSRTAAPSTILGSIGVYSARFDESAMYAKEGVKVHLIASGPDKGAGYPGTEISADHLAKTREEVMALAGEFFAHMSHRQALLGRAPLDPAVHFTGATFRAKSPAGALLHDGLVPSRQAHLRQLAALYTPRRR